jgi:hypothetical protein
MIRVSGFLPPTIDSLPAQKAAIHDPSGCEWTAAAGQGAADLCSPPVTEKFPPIESWNGLNFKEILNYSW